MADTTCLTEVYTLDEAIECIQAQKPIIYTLNGPSAESREFIKTLAHKYLELINKDKFYNLLGLCLEEVISNCVKANIKRAYFLSNELDISNPDEYALGMKNFKEGGLAYAKDMDVVKQVHSLGLYVKLSFKIENDVFFITAHNNSVISDIEIERINKKLKLSDNQTPEEMFMHSIDTTEGAGLGIIMITKILSQISANKDCFSIKATDTETITELKIYKD